MARRLAESDDAAPLVLGEAPPLLVADAPLDALPAESLAEEPLPELPDQPMDPPPIVRPSGREAAEAAPPAPAPSPPKDMLWFLSGRSRQAAPESAPPAPVEAQGPAPPASQPAPARSARPGVVRGPLPPFFGSSAEAQKAEVVLVQPSSAPGPAVMLAPAPQPAKAAANGQAGPAPGPAVGPAGGPVPPGGHASDGLRNGAASALFGRVAAGPESATPHTHALEAMVAEMLRPMLQRWLDENMPRLVATALQDEAVRMAARDRDKV
jgi:cell pole-organizing protein PopZ